MTSTTERPILRAAPSENWDADFEFQGNEDGDTPAPPLPTRNLSATSHARLQEWAEPGPSTPIRRRAQPPQTENWDDDFEDAADSPARRPGSHSHRKRGHNHNSVGSSKRRAGPAVENWDDDFELGKADSPVGTRRRHGHDSSDSDSDPAELGFGDKEEDKTITARSRRGLAAQATSPPPVPPIPPLFSHPSESDPAPFPRSPTASVFSVPTSRDRDSMSIAYGSTAHLNLRPTLSGSSAGITHVVRGFAALPPSPPIHRERRRLRKKSRPRPIDDNVIELVDLDNDEDPPLPLPIPRTPEQDNAELPAAQLPSEPSSPAQSRPAGVLSRIGSVSRRWGRRKRGSVGPEEVLMHEREREQLPPPAPVMTDNDATPVAPSQSRSSKNWFFRGGVGSRAEGGGDDSEVSGREDGEGLDRREAESPTKRKGRRSESGHGLRLQPKSRPSPDALALNSPPGSPLKQRGPVFSRHVSYGGAPVSKTSSRGSGSMSMEDLSLQSSREDVVKEKGKDKEPNLFMNRMRRISLGNSATGLKVKHRKTKSSVGPDDTRQQEGLSPPTLPPLPSPSPFGSTADLSFDAESPVNPKAEQGPLSAGLLPPIELRPPSPTRSPPSKIRSSESEPITSSYGLPPSVDSLLRPSTAGVPTKLSMSPQSASLGRSAGSPVAANAGAGAGSSGTIVPRRNSLGDLKIPARISQAQVGLRRDLELVRDFAASVDKLKQLQLTYVSLVQEVHQVLITSRPSSPPPPSTSAASLFGFTKPKVRTRSNTNPVPPPPDAHLQLASEYQTIESKYKIVWECAELLIELGGGGPSATSPSTSVSAPTMQVSQSAPPIEGRKSRERAITLAGDEAKPDPALLPTTGPPIASPPNPAWRASTGRHDLSSRQLLLLREMLHANSDASPSSSFLGAHGSEIPEETAINRGWKWGDAMSSTITLPSEESSAVHSSPMKKRRASKIGMSGLRDMLRLLKKNTLEQQYQIKPTPPTSATESSLDVRQEPKSVRSQVPTQRRRAKTSTGPESMKSLREHPNSPYGTTNSLSHKPSPRRPSLASIFRIGQKHKLQSTVGLSTEDVAGGGSGHSRAATEEDEDWDEIDSASDLDLATRAFGVAADGMATVKGRSKKNMSPYQLHADPSQGGRLITPHSGSNASQSSIWNDPRRLSNVEENGDSDQRQSRPETKSRRRSSIFPSPSPKRPPSRGWKPGKSGSVRSAPPLDTPVDPKLAMTPQNIKPLLENAKEVELRLNDCIEELRVLVTSALALAAKPSEPVGST